MISISLFNDNQDTKQKGITKTNFQELCEWFEKKANRIRANKADAGMFCLTNFNQGRSNENARPTNLFGLDFDDQGNQINEVTAYLAALGCNWFLYTTHSHKPTHHKFRVILELAQPIHDADENRLVFMVLNSLFTKQGFALDDACKNISRLWYQPASPSSDSPCQCHKRTDRGPLDISPQLALARKEQQALAEFQEREAKRAKAKVAKALAKGNDPYAGAIKSAVGWFQHSHKGATQFIKWLYRAGVPPERIKEAYDGLGYRPSPPDTAESEFRNIFAWVEKNITPAS